MGRCGSIRVEGVLCIRQAALVSCPASMGPRARWDAIAVLVPGKTRQQCVDRFRVLRDRLRLEESRAQVLSILLAPALFY